MKISSYFTKKEDRTFDKCLFFGIDDAFWRYDPRYRNELITKYYDDEDIEFHRSMFIDNPLFCIEYDKSNEDSPTIPSDNISLCDAENQELNNSNNSLCDTKEEDLKKFFQQKGTPLPNETVMSTFMEYLLKLNNNKQSHDNEFVDYWEKSRDLLNKKLQQEEANIVLNDLEEDHIVSVYDYFSNSITETFCYLKTMKSNKSMLSTIINENDSCIHCQSSDNCKMFFVDIIYVLITFQVVV